MLLAERSFTAGVPTSVAFSPDGASLAVGLMSGLAIVKIATERSPIILVGRPTLAVRYLPNAMLIAGTLRGVELRDGRSGVPIAGTHTGESIVTAVAVSPDGMRSLSAGAEGTITVQNPVVRGVLVALKSPQNVVSLSFNPRGTCLAVASAEAVEMWHSEPSAENSVCK
jgi:WD40 repeat protein